MVALTPTGCIVLEDRRRLGLRAPEIPEKVLKVNNLLPTHACSNKLRLRGAERRTCLPFCLPANGAMVEGEHESGRRTAIVGVSRIVAVDPSSEDIGICRVVGLEESDAFVRRALQGCLVATIARLAPAAS